MARSGVDALCEWVEMEIGAWTMTGVSFMLLPTVELSKAETLLIFLVLFLGWTEIVSWFQEKIKAVKRQNRKKRRNRHCGGKAA